MTAVFGVSAPVMAAPCVVSKHESSGDVGSVDAGEPFEVPADSVKTLALGDGYRGMILHSSEGKIALVLSNGSMRAKTIGTAEAGALVRLETDGPISVGYSIRCGGPVPSGEGSR